jgi:serine/threonine protein kinase
MSPVTSDLPGSRLGEFELVRELGRGGMGVVYEAVQTSLNRNVALKVLGPGLGLAPRAVDRFRREAEAAAKLHHTNIVPVYATGEENGVHFYAMELVEGPSLDTVIRRERGGWADAARTERPAGALTGPYPPAEPGPAPGGSDAGAASSPADRFDRAAAMVAEVADALHHAHSQGVTHRDIKPSNLLLSSDGRLSVTDFGLARMLEQPGMTVTGEFVGTPAYMSPEQVTAGRVPSTTAPTFTPSGRRCTNCSRSGRRSRRRVATSSSRWSCRRNRRRRGRSSRRCRGTWRPSASNAWRRTPTDATRPPRTWPTTSAASSTASPSAPGGSGP